MTANTPRGKRKKIFSASRLNAALTNSSIDLMNV